MRTSLGRRRTSLLLVAAATLTVMLTPMGAFAASSPAAKPAAKTPRPIAVSVPAEPVTIGPGQTSTVHVRVINPGPAPVRVTLMGRGLSLGDDGKVNLTNAPDPTWQGHVEFPAGELPIPAQGFRDVFVTVRMPDRIDPDFYFVGFVVRPVPNPSNRVTLINQIGSFFTIDVPGPRVRRLIADLQVPGFAFGPIHLGHLTLGTHTTGALRIRNVGHAQARFWGENDTTSNPGGSTPAQQRIPKSLLPVGRTRTYHVRGAPAWPIGLVTMTVHIIYPDKTDTATTEIVLTKRTLVASPWALVFVGALIVLCIWWWLRRRRRRRPQTRRRLPPDHRPPSRRHRRPTVSKRRPDRSRRAAGRSGVEAGSGVR